MSGNNLHLNPPAARPGLSQSSTPSLRPKVALSVPLVPSSLALPRRVSRLPLVRSLRLVEPNVNALLLLPKPMKMRMRMRMRKWLMRQVVLDLLLQLLRSRFTVDVKPVALLLLLLHQSREEKLRGSVRLCLRIVMIRWSRGLAVDRLCFNRWTSHIASNPNAM
jgi:hypothetical protein